MIEKIGGRGRDRTGGPLLAKQVLSQLSYTPHVYTSENTVNCFADCYFQRLGPCTKLASVYNWPQSCSSYHECKLLRRACVCRCRFVGRPHILVSHLILYDVV